MALLGPGARQAAAQGSLAERLGLDKLHLTALGVAAGPVRPARVEPTVSYALQADYGEIAQHWRIFFIASYWGSRFTDEAVNGFVAQLRKSIVDPAQDDTIRAGQVRVSDISLDLDARYLPLDHAFVSPYVSIGLGAHVVNAESPLIQGTFVESALDNIGTGISAGVGLDLARTHRVSVGVQARYTLLANVRFGSLRASGSYHFALAPPPSSR
jgi:hypothetical protein